MSSRLTHPPSLPTRGKVKILCIFTAFTAQAPKVDPQSNCSTVYDPQSQTKKEFTQARALIKSLKSNTDYSELCGNYPPPGGAYKKACRIKRLSSLGFLVCRDAGVCEQMIQQELEAFKQIIAGGIRTVKVDQSMVKGVKCTDTTQTICAGFLEEWVGPQSGQMVHLSNAFYKGQVRAIVKPVLEKVAKQGLAATAADIEKIRKYIQYKPPVYRQICDLQGFFLYNGGFLVNDPAGVRNDMQLDERCYSKDEPTTAQVLKGLDEILAIIKELQHSAF